MMYSFYKPAIFIQLTHSRSNAGKIIGYTSEWNSVDKYDKLRYFVILNAVISGLVDDKSSLVELVAWC